MSHYPPQYGLAANIDMPKLDYEKMIKEQPSDSQVALSVQKGLWFPIMTNLTNLCLDKGSDKQNLSIAVFFKVLKHGVGFFNAAFWSEIMSQVFFPMLEDIDLAIQNSDRRNDEQERNFFLYTINQLVQGFNDFLLENMQELAHIVPAYADLLVLFISQTQNRSINQVIIVCFNQLLTSVGPALDAEAWSMIIKTYTLCFSESMPKDLISDVQNYINITQVNSGQTKTSANQQSETKLENSLSSL
jgi:hypothetical protein